jgi:hypothetical protein
MNETSGPPDPFGRTSYYDEYFFSLDNYSYLGFYSAAIAKKLEPYTKNKPLVDLGGRMGLSLPRLRSLGIADYTVVDKDEYPVSQSARFIKKDALEYLQGLEKTSETNFMANGFFVKDILSSEKAKSILKEVHRLIMPEHGILVVARFEFEKEAQDVGLVDIGFRSRYIQVFSKKE